MNLLNSLTASQLRRAAALRTKIDKLQAELSRLAGGTPPAPAARTGRRRRFSAATRAKMAAAQQARWAKVRSGKK